ncbi:MAG: TGS domain-containing protein, partial [Carnobacterium sp.]
MSEIKIFLPDGAEKIMAAGVTTKDVAESISKGLAKKGLAGKFNGELVDYSQPLEENGTLEIITSDHEDALQIVRHSSAHLMANALKRLYPNIKFGVGPAIDTGFYYDTDTKTPITEEDLPRIEAEMMAIVKENNPIIRKELTRAEAFDLFKDDPYKVELITGLPENEKITVYTQGDFVDLCRGVHVPSTGRIQV